jgi:tetratricopeptide (TPR) repeat protein
VNQVRCLLHPVAANFASSVAAWESAWADFVHFVGDPFAQLETANETDDEFAMGPVFCATYRILGGAQPGLTQLVAEHEWANSRAAGERELGHVEALNHLFNGDFTKAARHWDKLARNTRDFAAVRFAHDVYLHIGNVPNRLQSSQRAMEMWQPSDPGWAFIASQHSFALEEAGFYDEAANVGWQALEADPQDLWALHALAHVFESTGDQPAALSLLEDRQETWSKQDSLSVHIWWHYALRLIEDKRFDEVLAIHDQLVPEATTPFRLCDLSSMLWRLELVGVDVGHRWDHLCDALQSRAEKHTAGFLDTHSALVYTRRPEHPAAEPFFSGLIASHADGQSENDQIFRAVVRPLAEAIRAIPNDHVMAARLFDSVEPQAYRIGGSIAQRELISMTREALEAT